MMREKHSRNFLVSHVSGGYREVIQWMLNTLHEYVTERIRIDINNDIVI
jgi:hypothetical protein